MPKPIHPPSLHANFFSSLKQVEKRLKLDTPSESRLLFPSSFPPSSPAPQQKEDTQISTSSLGSPIYITSVQPHDSSTTDSQTPREFLTNSHELPVNGESPAQLTPKNEPLDLICCQGDDIGQLMQLLGLSEGEEGKEGTNGFICETGNIDCCACEGGFYEKIAKIKVPKCPKEVGRLECWIKYFSSGTGNGSMIEPLRLAHLLLGKASLTYGDPDGCEFLDFPSTVEEFLWKGPP